MKAIFWVFFIIFFTGVGFTLSALSNARSVKADFDRCKTNIERFERTLKRYEDIVDALKINIGQLPITGRDSFSREVSLLANQCGYFRDRLERSNGQADKIDIELQNLKGPNCPSCIASSVNMYCRNGEMMQNDINDYLLKAEDLTVRVSSIQFSSTGVEENSGRYVVFAQRRITADSLNSIVKECSEPTVKALRTQGAVNINRADSLFGINDTTAALTVLDISLSLFQKALQRCTDK